METNQQGGKEGEQAQSNPAPEGLGFGGAPCSELRMCGPNARIIIQNCHAILRHKFRQVPLWSMVGHITGHGSGNSAAICESANLDPHQPAGAKSLRDYFPNVQGVPLADEKPPTKKQDA